MKQLCAINPPVGQPDRLTPWVDEAVIIIRPAVWCHPFTIYTCILALLVKKILGVTPSSPKAITCWISQISNTGIHFTCIEYLWSVESENHIGPKKSIVALNRLFHGTLHLLACKVQDVSLCECFLNFLLKCLPCLELASSSDNRIHCSFHWHRCNLFMHQIVRWTRRPWWCHHGNTLP